MGKNQFDAAVSVETMHHFTHEEKIALYKKINASLKPDGFYIETDFIALDQNYEDYHYRENRRLRTELGITTGYYHYDTPCTIENQLQLLQKASFSHVEKIWQLDCTAILLAKK